MSSLASELDIFFRDVAPLATGDRLLVAFSGGPDSTALLAGLVPWAARRGVELLAAHLDHACDPGSAARAAAALALARRLGVAAKVERRAAEPGTGSPEEALRRLRYGFLAEVAAAWGARWIATGHTRDDQAETVILRWLAGTGLDGLAGIAPRRGRIVRPLLALARATVHGSLPRGLEPLADPGNDDRAIPRVFVRRQLLPALAADEPDLGAALARLAARARGAREALDSRLLGRLEVSEEAAGLGFSAAVWAKWETPLQTAALAALARRCGLTHSLGRAAGRELVRQLVPAMGLGGTSQPGGSARIGCDGPGGLRIESRPDGRWWFGRRATGAGPPGAFSCRLAVPGEVEIPELAATLRVQRVPVAPWMFHGERHRAALEWPAAGVGHVVVRSRLPGDRLRPLGAPGERKLKEVLIDHRVPRERRDRLPLVVVDGRIAWVPGVTIDEAFRLAPGASSAWVVEVLSR